MSLLASLRSQVRRGVWALLRPWRDRADARADRRLARLRAHVRAQYPTHADFVILGGPGCDLATAWYRTGVAGERAFRTAWRAVQAAAARQDWYREEHARLCRILAEHDARRVTIAPRPPAAGGLTSAPPMSAEALAALSKAEDAWKNPTTGGVHTKADA